MKYLVFCIGLLWTIQTYAQTPQEKEIDRDELSTIANKKFDMTEMGGREFTSKESSLSRNMFASKESSLFGKKGVLGFDKQLPKKMTELDKEYRAGELKGFQKKNPFIDVQKRFDTTKQSSFSTREFATEFEKVSGLEGKRYQSRVADLIKGQLNEMQKQQFEKIDLDDTALSVEQIREMLSKD